MTSSITAETHIPQLGKALRTRHVEMIAIGGIIGAGLFVGSSTAIANTGPAVVLSYLFAGLLILLIMRMLSEMAVANPGVGAFSELVRVGAGSWAGFLTSWLFWYFWAVVVAIEAIAGAKIIHMLLPGMPLAEWHTALLLVLVLTGVNLLSTLHYGEFEFWFALIKVVAILAFILISAAFAFGITPVGGMGFANLAAYEGFAPKGWAAVLGAVTTVIFSLTGAEIATIAAAESKEPRKVIARLTASITIRLLIFYVLSILLIVMVVPWTQIVPGVSPFATALDAMHIPYAGLVMNLVVLVAVLSCLNSGIYVTSRILFSMAAHGDAPQGLVALNARQVPARTIYLCSVVAMLAVLTSAVSPDQAFSFLVNTLGALMLFIYAVMVHAHVRMRQRLEREEPERLQVKMWLFPWLSYGVLVAIGAILVAMARSPSSFRELASSCLIVALAIAGWLYRRRFQRA